MVVGNVNQNPPSNVIQMQEMVEELTSAIIRTPSGRQIVVEWGAQNEEQRVADVIRQFYEQFEEYEIINEDKAANKQDDTVHITEDKENDLQEATNNETQASGNVDENNNEVNKSENINNSTNTKTGEGTKNSTETNTNEDTKNNTEAKTGEGTKTNAEVKTGEGAKNNTEAKTDGSTDKGTGNQANTNTTKTDGKAQDQNTSGATMNLKAKSNEVVLKTNYFLSLRTALQLQTGVGGKIQKNGAWVNASQDEIKKYFLPNDENINKYKYQFLSLKATAGISETEAAKFLKGKGILSGKAAMFLDAAKKNNINEIYLMAHACLETGNGTSQLATGVKYKGQTVYNMFGVGAYDNSAVASGARYAYNAGWTTPEKAIYGGAKFISENYINHSTFEQDTLYEMRWNPGSPSKHQYATDVAWAAKQAVWIEQIYKIFDDPHVTFDIPVYRAGTGYK